MALQIMRSTDGPLTRENYLAAVKGKTFDLDGLKLDFTNDIQGSDLVVVAYLQDRDYDVITLDDLDRVLIQ